MKPKPIYPFEWTFLRPGECVFSQRSESELIEVASHMKRQHGVTVEVRPTEDGFHLYCTGRESC